ncbi:hypothetical protein NCS57_00435000 [Fusarium keratoplasticum]|uniref:Uncharacterized protein n=1 Tax=Fusarium keratoplasticum TaxID=1328300 RepID=A0ACC0R606_9HYPO|nr:hypothetical protein NCS57_00435000 [Fusarium keratoplasticum]KAI8675339.1 hypothetical protein NCS57_00435000 [Fusarium keratoplasticum]
MPLNFFRRNSRRTSEQETASPAPLETVDQDRLKVLDIVESFLTPIIIPYPPIVFRTLQAEGQEEFTVQLAKPINADIQAKELYVKFKKDSYGRTVVFMSMQQPSSSMYVLPVPGRLYNWTTYMGPNYRWGPITVKVEDSVQGRWLSTTMHASFGGDYVDFRMKQSIMGQGESVTLTGPRPDGVFALGCDRLWSQ